MFDFQNIDVNKDNILKNKLAFGDIDLEGVSFIIKTYKGEEDDAFNVFINLFDNKAEWWD